MLEHILRPESPHFQFSMGPLGALAAKLKTKFNMFYSCTEKNPFLNVLYIFPLEYQIFVNQFHALFSIYVFKQCGMHSLEMNSENLRG